MIDTRFQPPQIGEVLESIRSRGIALQMRMEPAQEQDISLLLAIDSANDLLVLDAPRNMDDETCLPGQRLDVSVWKNGIQLRFEVQVRHQGSHEGHPALFTGWPSAIEYIQRRNAFRIRLRDIRSRADFILDNGIHIPGRILDISVTGFSALVEQDVEIQQGQRADCEIEIERRSQFFALSEIRNINHVGISDHIRIGARFIDIRSEHKFRLEKLIREYEREQLRIRRSRNKGS